VLGGEIALQSTPGVGSTFTLHLPMAPQDLVESRSSEAPSRDEEGPRVRSEEDRRALKGRRILVVDDDARNLYAMTSLLESYGMHVAAASSAREAYDALRAGPEVDVVLMDIMMPEIDGYQATRDIHSMMGLEKLPVIALTAKASATDRAQALAAGCIAYIAKPAEVREITATIQRALSGLQAARTSA
jgi:CheY-like chemotaxis protein